MNFKSTLCAVGTIAFSAITFNITAQADDYQIIDLGTLGGTYSYGRDINEQGHVTGTSGTAVGEGHAFFYDGNIMRDLGTLPSPLPDSVGEGINDNDQVVGSVMMENIPTRHAFIYENNTMYDLGTPSYGKDINESGHVTGYLSLVDIFGNYVHAFIYDGNTIQDLGTDRLDSTGYGINNHGHVTGENNRHAYIYNGSSMQDLGTLVGGDMSRGRDINDSDQVTGWSYTTSGLHAFFYDGNQMHDLGTLGGSRSEGWGLNNIGQVVGLSQLPSGENAAFLYVNNQMLDLCTLTNCTNNGWTSFSAATAINDRGDITGYGVINGETHAFLVLAGEIPPPPDPEICDDGIDNDSDGLTDCEDTQNCSSHPACNTQTEYEICNDGIDNDDDGLTDCLDRLDCRQDPACKTGGGGGGDGTGGGGKNR